MEVTRNRTAGRAGDPEVGAAGIENDLEILGWCTKSNGAEV